jgi:hypothetical protein
MSLNKLTDSSKINQQLWMNVGCNDIKCKTLEVDGNEVIPRLHGVYTPSITSSIGTFSNTTAYWSFEETYLDIWFSTELLVVTTNSFMVIDVPYPPNLATTSPVGTVPAGVLTAIYGAGSVGALQQNQVNGSGNALSLGFSYNNASIPPNGSTVFINGNMRVYTNPIV